MMPKARPAPPELRRGMWQHPLKNGSLRRIYEESGALVPPLPVDVGQAMLRWSLLNDPDVMVTTWNYDFSLATGTAADHATTIKDIWLASFPATQCSTSYTFLGCRVLEGQAAGQPVPGAADVSITGTLSIPSPPQNVAYLLHKQTPTPGRSGQGRNYLPPAYSFGETEVAANGAILAAVIGPFNSKLGTVLTSLDSNNLGMTVLDKASVEHIVTSWVLDPLVASRRKRLRR